MSKYNEELRTWVGYVCCIYVKGMCNVSNTAKCSNLTRSLIALSKNKKNERFAWTRLASRLLR